MILIDTHIWVWWAADPQKLRREHAELLSRHEQRIAVSIVSCWEIAKLVEYGRLELDRPVLEWITDALATLELEILPLTPAIAVESTQLPAGFHRDPADQIIVATARVHRIPLLTEDSRILEYPHVQLTS